MTNFKGTFNLHCHLNIEAAASSKALVHIWWTKWRPFRPHYIIIYAKYD